jgi:hypothetical protein
VSRTPAVLLGGRREGVVLSLAYHPAYRDSPVSASAAK